MRALRDAGFGVTRLENPLQADGALARALEHKRGYIWGAMEILTQDALDAADRLEAIAFPGSGYTEFIPVWEEATRRGVAISTAVGLNAPAVSEYAITLMLAMIRGLPVVSARPPAQAAFPARELGGLTLGIVGLGHTGRRTARMGRALGMRVLAAGRRKPRDLEDGIEAATLARLLGAADIVSLHVDRKHGLHVLGSAELRRMKKGALLVNVAFPDAVDCAALYSQLREGRLRAAFDAPPSADFSNLPSDSFLASSEQVAFNTVEANRRVGDRVTQAMINLLTRGDDDGVVNPHYRRHRA
jgi:phosphoglycerate dehydrogenase-like enzyme